MTMAKDKDEFVRARRHANLTPGGMVRVLRTLQEMSQNELARVTGIAQPLLSGIEHERYTLGLERAKKIARALKVHPGVLLFADWEEDTTGMTALAEMTASVRHKTAPKRTHKAVARKKTKAVA